MSTFYYEVTGATFPDFTKETPVGYYIDESTANRVRKINMPLLPAGIDVRVNPWKGEVVKLSDGNFRLKKMPGGQITLIKKEFDSEEHQRIVNFRFA